MTTTTLDGDPTLRTEAGPVPETALQNQAIPSRYQILSQLGTGGMGIVYKVRDQETNDIIALKILKAEIAADPAMQENLKREVLLARKVTHRNVCRIHEFVRANGTACISMELVEGESLLARLQCCGRLPWTGAFKIGAQICAGLREAHAQGIVHRDLKPANIMVDENGAAKIMDFGIARLLQGTAAMTCTLVGTPAYMAPEQVEFTSVDARTDIYALGLLLYEIVTGVPAFHGETPIAVALKQLRESPMRPREIVSALPAGAEAVILKCLQKKPEKRFQSVDELATALQKLLAPKPAVSLWGSFSTDMRNAYRELHASLRSTAEAGVDFVRRWNGKARPSRRTQAELGLSLAAICIAGVWMLLPSRSTHARLANPTLQMAKATPSPLGPAASSAHGEKSPITAYRVDLTPIDPQAIAVQPHAKAPAAARVAKISSKAAQKAPAPKLEVATVTPAEDADADQPNADDVAAESAVQPAAVTPAPVETAKEETPASGNQPAPGRYFEVGSFKDSAWADQAVEKLAELGFHAVSVKKSRLWMQSYQVRVGPYMDTQTSEAAQQDLISRGFKPHAVK